MVQIRVPLPPGVSPGVVIGKRGDTVRGLSQRSGARIAVTDESVTVSGPAAAVAAAQGLLQQHFDSFLKQGGAYPHPRLVLYLLAPAFGAGDAARATFVRRNDESTAAAECRETLYSLVPAATPGGGGGVDDLAGMLAGGLSLGERPRGGGGRGGEPIALFPASAQERALASAVDAASTAVVFEPAFDAIKLRFNFGTQLFYRGPAEGRIYALRELQAWRIPADTKSLFSNGVPAATAAALEALLLGPLGFVQSESRERVSLHLQDVAAGAGHALSLDKRSDGTVALRKVKSQNSKLVFLVRHAGGGAPDWRAKLLAQYKPPAADDGARCTLEALAAGAVAAAGGALRLPGLAGGSLRVERERHKSKRVFTGALGGLALKVSINKVFNPGSGATHTEVTGCAAALNELLGRALAARRLGPEDAAELARGLETLLEFAGDVAARLAREGGA